MKILGMILAVLMLSGSAFVGFVGANKARQAANDIDQVTAGMTAEQKSALGEAVPSTGRLTFGSIVGILGAVAAAGLLAVAFARKSLVPKLAAAAVLLTVLSIAIFPYIETGPTDGMAPRTQAIVAAVLAAIGAVGAMLAARQRV
jgi:hypothetical protein